jgi:hypothetical protein
MTPPQLQESQPDPPQLVFQEEEPFEIEIVVPESQRLRMPLLRSLSSSRPRMMKMMMRKSTLS